MAKINTDYGAQALDLNQLLNHQDGTGIVSGCTPSVGTNAMEVDVASGTARVNGTNYSITASTVLLDSANSDYPRKDLVVVDNTGSVTKITGTAEEAIPAGSTRRNTRRPRPSDISGSDVAVIAEVWVGAGASDIVSGDISDRRLIPLVEGFLDVDGDGVSELQDSHADFGGGDARNVGALDADEELINDTATDPAANGEFRRNGTDVKVYSGGGVQNLSNIVWADSDGDSLYEQEGDGIDVPQVNNGAVLSKIGVNNNQSLTSGTWEPITWEEQKNQDTFADGTPVAEIDANGDIQINKNGVYSIQFNAYISGASGAFDCFARGGSGYDSKRATSTGTVEMRMVWTQRLNTTPVTYQFEINQQSGETLNVTNHDSRTFVAIDRLG